jgi:hypothetical protein
MIFFLILYVLVITSQEEGDIVHIEEAVVGGAGSARAYFEGTILEICLVERSVRLQLSESRFNNLGLTLNSIESDIAPGNTIEVNLQGAIRSGMGSIDNLAVGDKILYITMLDTPHYADEFRVIEAFKLDNMFD